MSEFKHIHGYLAPNDFLVRDKSSRHKLPRNGAYHAALEAVQSVPDEWLSMRDKWTVDRISWHGHTTRYVARVGEEIRSLSGTYKDVVVFAPPIGGLSPLAAIEESIVDVPRNVFFKCLDESGPSTVISDNDQSVGVMVDDGLGSLSDQVRLLELLSSESTGKWTQMRKDMKRIQAELGLNSLELAPYYREVIEGLHQNNIVIYPVVSRNQAFMKILDEYLLSNPSQWSDAQVPILDPQVCYLLEEEPQTVGGMINDVPCRDVGVTFETLANEQLIPLESVDVLKGEGLDSAEFRILSNIPGLISADKKGQRDAIHIFSRNLSQTL